MPNETFTLEEFLEALRKVSESEREKGSKFEEAMEVVLPQLPEYDFDKAWLWKNWPNREAVTGLDAKDEGIDLVARVTGTNDYWAVQCKFWNPKSTVGHRDLGTFYTASGKEGFSGRLIITTTDNWTPTAERNMQNQTIETKRLRLKDLRELEISWNWNRPDKTKVPKRIHDDLWYEQKEALEKAQSHYKDNERGQLIMACGTGKTFTSLKIAESIVPKNGSVLFLVPSLSLMKQTITEWARERNRETRYLGVCSDKSVARQDGDNTQIADLSIPVESNPTRIFSILGKENPAKDLTVVFCTYQSLDRISLAQQVGLPEFDFIICDEAHRTTGIDKESTGKKDQKNSNFVKVHDQRFVQGRKRLYMTATPRIYTDATKEKADEHEVDIFSMDKEATYGIEFYRLSFGDAVDAGLLVDYKVIILNISEDYASKLIGTFGSKTVTDLSASTDDIAKIIGCYDGLRSQGLKNGGTMLKRAVSFSNSIKNSKHVVEKFAKVVEELDEKENDGFTCILDHVDGTETALARSKKLDWLSQDPGRNENGEICHILSNARCLTEGVDVPALDAILFMNPRKSQVDVVQAVGRVMRKAKGKQYGYVILPVVIPIGQDINEALDSNDTYGVVWQVLRALRSHDERLTNLISRLELNEKKIDGNIFIGGRGIDPDDDPMLESDEIERAHEQLELGLSEEYAGKIYAKIVDKVGDKKYLEKWAKDTANLHDLLVTRIDQLRANHPEVSSVYDNFLESIQSSIHDGLDHTDASSMLAQQLITRPVFDALFEDYDFSTSNVVSTSLNAVLDEMQRYDLVSELNKLKRFYDSVKSRVARLDNDRARQTVITELYEKFFTTAFPKTSESLGIAYTPMEIVDFTLKSANEVMNAEFGRGLSDKDVHIIDPFTGTGSFLVRLINNPELIKNDDIKRKFSKEIWANELLLLAYYIASVNIEMAYHQRVGKYSTFPGISLTDTLELYEHEEQRLPGMLEGNSVRIAAQKKAPIQVIVGNPPWSARQKLQNDNNANRAYPKLDDSIKESYAKKSNATSLSALYDKYIKSIKWASNRLGNEGIIAYVTNAGWLESTGTDGMRLCIEEEFDSVWVLDLRGDINKNIKSKGDAKEGENVFGQKTKTGVCISLFVKNPNRKSEKAIIKYHNIGNELSRQRKLDILTEATSLFGLQWQGISPNAQGDWLNLRDPKFQDFVELGNDKVKEGREPQPQTIFRSYSGGLKSNRDAWVYNFNFDSVAKNMSRMIDNYNDQVEILKTAQSERTNIDVDEVIDTDSTRINWDRELKRDAKNGRKGRFSKEKIVRSLYRPFTIQHLYFDRQFNNMVYRQPYYFPTPDHKNIIICLTGKGSAEEFSCLVSNFVSDVNLFTPTQTFPRWVYEIDEVTKQIIREDNITNNSLKQFQDHYGDSSISKDDIFYYVYGILHAPDYREKYSADLRLGLPRIPMANNFRAFSDAGAELAKLHLNWSNSLLSETEDKLTLYWKNQPNHIEIIPEEAWKVNKMRLVNHNDELFVQYSQHLTIGPIPDEAMKYTVGNRTPLHWIIDRYRWREDTKGGSGIVNDPNDWIAEEENITTGYQPHKLYNLISQIIHMSKETQKIIDDLPDAVSE